MNMKKLKPGQTLVLRGKTHQVVEANNQTDEITLDNGETYHVAYYESKRA